MSTTLALPAPTRSARACTTPGASATRVLTLPRPALRRRAGRQTDCVLGAAAASRRARAARPCPRCSGSSERLPFDAVSRCAGAPRRRPRSRQRHDAPAVPLVPSEPDAPVAPVAPAAPPAPVCGRTSGRPLARPRCRAAPVAPTVRAPTAIELLCAAYSESTLAGLPRRDSRADGPRRRRAACRRRGRTREIHAVAHPLDAVATDLEARLPRALVAERALTDAAGAVDGRRPREHVDARTSRAMRLPAPTR